MHVGAWVWQPLIMVGFTHLQTANWSTPKCRLVSANSTCFFFHFDHVFFIVVAQTRESLIAPLQLGRYLTERNSREPMKQWRLNNVNRKWTFWIHGQWFCPKFLATCLYNRKDTKQYTFCSVQAYFKGKDITSVWRASLKNAGTS